VTGREFTLGRRIEAKKGSLNLTKKPSGLEAFEGQKEYIGLKMLPPLGRVGNIKRDLGRSLRKPHRAAVLKKGRERK